MKRDERQYTEFPIEGMETDYPGPDGKKNVFRLFFDFNEIVDAETQSGYNLLPALYSPDRMSAGQLRAVTWALLKTAHTAVTITEAGDLLSKGVDVVRANVLHELGMQLSDEAIFGTIARMAVERPVDLVRLLARARPFIPEMPAEENPPAEDQQAEPPANG